MTLDTNGLNRVCNAAYPSSTALGYLLLLDATLALNKDFSLNLSTGLMTFSSNHKLVTGSRFRITSTGAFPISNEVGTLSPTTDYYFIRVDALTGRMTSTSTGSTFTYSSIGSGSLQVNEQTLLPTDTKEALINHEVSHPSYTRGYVELSGSATDGQKSYTRSISVASGQPNMLYKHRLLLLGATSTLNDTTGTKDHLFTSSDTKIVSAGQTALIALTFKITN
jgi:hypothetical protein